MFFSTITNCFPTLPCILTSFHLFLPVFTYFAYFHWHSLSTIFIHFSTFFYIFSHVYMRLQPTTSIFNKQRPPLFISVHSTPILHLLQPFLRVFHVFSTIFNHHWPWTREHISFIIFKFYFALFICFKLFMVIFLLTLPDGLPLWGHPVRLLQCTYPSRQLPGRLVLLRQYPSYNDNNSMLYRYTMIRGKGPEFVNVWQIA